MFHLGGWAFAPACYSFAPTWNLFANKHTTITLYVAPSNSFKFTFASAWWICIWNSARCIHPEGFISLLSERLRLWLLVWSIGFPLNTCHFAKLVMQEENLLHNVFEHIYSYLYSKYWFYNLMDTYFTFTHSYI